MNGIQRTAVWSFRAEVRGEVSSAIRRGCTHPLGVTGVPTQRSGSRCVHEGNAALGFGQQISCGRHRLGTAGAICFEGS